MARRQSAEDRIRRLEKRCCPVHGIWMSQVDRHYYEEGGKHHGEEYTIVECPRSDCEIQAKAFGFYGPRYLLPEWEYLLVGEN